MAITVKREITSFFPKNIKWTSKKLKIHQVLQIGSSGNAEYYGNVACLNKTKIFFPWLVFSIFNAYLVLFMISITTNFHHLNNKLPESLFVAGVVNKNWLSNLRQYGFLCVDPESFHYNGK